MKIFNLLSRQVRHEVSFDGVLNIMTKLKFVCHKHRRTDIQVEIDALDFDSDGIKQILFIHIHLHLSPVYYCSGTRGHSKICIEFAFWRISEVGFSRRRNIDFSSISKFTNTWEYYCYHNQYDFSKKKLIKLRYTFPFSESLYLWKKMTLLT